MKTAPLAVVVASGGMDSCVTAAFAAKTHDLCLMHLNYGQRTEQRELMAFYAQVDHFRARHKLVVDASHFTQIGGSALIDAALGIPETPVEGEIPITYVPFRNANILAMAVSWAEVIGAEKIFIGAVEEDSSGYPDCRESFIEAFNQVIQAGTRPETTIRVEAPLIHLSKGDIVRRGLALAVPFEHTWSCYQAEDVACGRCDSCRLRLKGFREAGSTDPLPYATTP